MELISRRAGTLLGIGLVLGLGWAIEVTTSTPGWFDPDGVCAEHPNAEVHTSWFPPKASCASGNGTVQDYISPTKSVVLSVVGVLILILLVAGLILTIRRLTGEPGAYRTAEDLGKRRRNQLTFGALDMAVVVAVLTGANVFAIILGGLPGGILFVLAAMVGLSALSVVLDRHMGPLPSTALDSRRRGTVAGLTVFGVIFAATAVAGQLPFFRLWAAPLAAITYAVVAGVQWSRLPHSRRDHEPSPHSVG